MVYSRKEDYICNYFGGFEWTNSTQWKGQAEFRQATLMDWKLSSGKVAGQARSGGRAHAFCGGGGGRAHGAHGSARVCETVCICVCGGGGGGVSV